MECFKCGVSEDKARLFDAVSEKGIVKICEKCSFDENIPIIRKPTDFQLKKSEKKQTIYERLSQVAGIKREDKISKDKKALLERQEVSLKDIVNKNFEMNLQEKPEQNNNLIDNFHWVIMRARRLRKLTQEQLAKGIAEPEAAIKLIEKGVLPKDNYKLVNKLENYLGIKIMKKEFVDKIKEEKPKRELGFDLETTKTLTISDLQDMKKEREAEIFRKVEEGEEALFD